MKAGNGRFVIEITDATEEQCQRGLEALDAFFERSDVSPEQAVRAHFERDALPQRFTEEELENIDATDISDEELAAFKAEMRSQGSAEADGETYRLAAVWDQAREAVLKAAIGENAHPRPLVGMAAVPETEGPLIVIDGGKQDEE